MSDLQIVGEANYTGLTAPAGPVSLLNGGAAATVNGVYQVIVYVDCTTGDPASDTFGFTLNWTDDSGPNSAPFNVSVTTIPTNYNFTLAGNYGPYTIPVYNLAGNDIGLSVVDVGSGGFGNAVYSLRASVVLLEPP